MERVFRLVDFNIYNEKQDPVLDEEQEYSSGSEPEKKVNRDSSKFVIQMFGLNEKGDSCSILAENYTPFFYVKVGDDWTTAYKQQFLDTIKAKVGVYYENSIVDCKLIKRKKLYGFDGGKEHKFIVLYFSNMPAFNKVKNLWYNTKINKLLPYGLKFKNTYTILYESNIPPLLRFFHIKDISPSGWIALPNKKTVMVKNTKEKKTTCTYECSIHYKDIIPLNENEKRVPYKICSFDIEASSSHGDFPVPVKSYKKLATNIIDYFDKNPGLSEDQINKILNDIILNAFGYLTELSQYVDLVYPIIPVSNKKELEVLIKRWLTSEIQTNEEDFKSQLTIESMFEKMNHHVGDDGADPDNNEDLYKSFNFKKNGQNQNEDLYATVFKKSASSKSVPKKVITVYNIITNTTLSRDAKLTEINISLNRIFPKLEGDKVTFIGSTFLKAGEPEPYLNHCAVLGTCGQVPVINSEIQTCASEKDLLLAWRDIIQRENPDIIIGYNIFGFDYKFMFCRAEETNCVTEFLKLSRNKDEICGTIDRDTERYKIEESSLSIASGQYDLHFIKIPGRLQVDLLNHFRREENLVSYKLDHVAGHFIGDYVKSLNIIESTTEIISNNLTGLQVGSYIHIEEIGHTTDYYQDGQKFNVISVNKETGIFSIQGHISPDFSKKVRWTMAKDDVTPKDIFRMTNGSDDDRAVIAKYCIQDCNLVHYLTNKVDVLTGFVEMAKICSVPINFLIMRGQGIKLTSYVAKKCREKRTLMPVIEKNEGDNDGYEGAIVLDPKCDLYLDNPVACVDYASLYPSSMMSENLSHDSKVWTKEYDLMGNLLRELGEKDDETDVFIYDNLPDYEYVDITYDTFKYVRKTPSSAAEKIKCGYKMCRFAQFKEGRAIMPSILEELLMARKSTRKLIPLQNDEFMKNVLDKRQLAYKLTANSLYGQCGAKTSTFYEKDVAAATTATGRLLLTYAKKVIEETYGNTLCDTKNGPVLTKAEYIYGDSVASYTPVYVKVNDVFNICTIEELAIKYGSNNWVQCVEEGKQEKDVCELENVETWSDKGWTKLKRVIRHHLAPHKKMMRILTHTGLVDVTDDHSLILSDGKEISPKDVTIGTELLHHELPNEFLSYYNKTEMLVNYDISQQHVTMAKQVAYQLLTGSSISLQNYKYNDNNNIYKICQLNMPFKNKLNSIQLIHRIPYEGYVYDLTTDNHHFAAGIGKMIVHNTDSVFFTFNLHTPEGIPIKGKEALEITIELAQEAGHLASSFLKAPHDLEYEKTFMPFCLLSKKRYVGMLYEHDPNKGKRKEMGIVLKRRDNAPIVKDIYGGIIDILMKQQDIKQAITFLKTSLKDIVDEKYPMDKLIITKSLRNDYKNPKQIAHKVLADRITARDPGSKPGSGDRIPFVYIHNPNKKALQGDRIETPTFIKENNLKIDYSFYISNQIMTPVQQVFALVLEKMWAMQNKVSKISKFKKEVQMLKAATDPEKFEDKLETLKNKEVKLLLFDEFLRVTNNQKDKVQPMTQFFTKRE